MSQAIVQRACAKLRSAMGDEAVVRLNFTADLREMLEVLEAIQPFLEDAEILLFRNSSVSEWLWFVREAACNIMNMVDELQDSHAPATDSNSYLHITRMLPRLAIANNGMAIKVKETKEQAMMIRLPRFDSMEVGTIFRRIIEERKARPVFEEALVLGRGSNKERIKTVLLLSAPRNITQEPITIIPIFGLAGSGKTTLAKMVLSDTDSLQNYDFRVWVHVSPELDFHGIGWQIICQVVEQLQADVLSDVVEMEHIMRHLQMLLHGKKVLPVLDDLWEEDPIQLQLLRSMLTCLSDRVDVIVTTCNHAIAKKICTVEPYRLNPLNDDTCWEIIKKSIRFQIENDEEEEKFGRAMARQCRGVPAAAREFANMLGPYHLSLSTFNMSYLSMPADLRLCCAYYCQIFPNGHNIVKDDLIHQWIALHLIEPSEILSATQIAEEYITRLLDLSFLQTAKLDHASGKDDKAAIFFTMHDLVHDLFRMSLECLSYSLANNHDGEFDDMLGNDVRALRCVGCSKVKFKDDSFSRNKCLHVLELQESSVQKLPESIWQLRRLGYLKISQFSELATLPDSFGHLINLLHVDFSGCSRLKYLPESFGKLTHLVHVDLSGCSRIVSLPRSFGELINVMHINLSGCSGLATLPESFGKLICLVHVNLSGCSGLATLPESFGNLIHLVHVNLSGCSGLATLPESFEDLFNLLHIDLSRCHRLSEILEVLQKLDKLVYLDLSFWSCFEGIKKCLGGLTNLEHLNLSNPCCYLAQHRSHLQELKDGIGRLTKLRYLNLSMCLNPIFYYHKSQEESLQFITECVKDLSTLEHLDLSHNTFLFDLPESIGDLNTLHTLNLSGCIRLKRVSGMKSLQFIDLRKCRGLESCSFVVRGDEDAPYISSNIVQLEGVNCQELQISCLENVRSRVEAQRIKMAEKQKLEKLKLSWTMHSLRLVEDGDVLEELVPPSTLQYLELHGYRGTCLPEYLGELTSLQELKIVYCKQLNSLPDSIQKLTSLKDLYIFDCPELKKWCQLEENKKVLAQIHKINYDEQASTSRPVIEEDCRSIDEVEAAAMD